VAALANGRVVGPTVEVEANGKRHGGLERIATLLEEIEARRERESRRSARP
jgi:hypothetical protein